MAIECLVLGAGQEVGKSCVVVTINGKRIMFDCGMHMGYLDHRRYPDFSRISKSGDFDNAFSCIIITHFHLDHIGFLPYFTEVCGYNGPIYMTLSSYPTKALAPLMLDDYRKVMVRRGEEQQFTNENILNCMKKVTAVDIKQTVQVDKDLQIRAYYAGHLYHSSQRDYPSICDEVDPVAKSIEAVNCVIRRQNDGKLYGSNRDYVGAISAIEDSLRGFLLYFLLDVTLYGHV
ncbi:hypothetical protein M8C21_025276, partial [Ambrosia artemisiifolia]